MGTSVGYKPLGRPRRDGRVTLTWIFRKCDGEHGLIWLRIGTVGGALVNAVMNFFKAKDSLHVVNILVTETNINQVYTHNSVCN
jgi:hypothetical protein